MLTILVCREDRAALNIRDSLLEGASWSEPLPVDRFAREESAAEGGNPGPLVERPEARGALCRTLVDRGPPMAMLELDGTKLHWEGIDKPVRSLLPATACIIFPSRHKAASGVRTLTVHTTGNYSSADFGGTPGALSVAAPGWSTAALRILARNAAAAGVDHGVSLECTHHGPLLDTPHFFIEIGSDEGAWEEKPSGDVLAATILELRLAGPARGPVLVGVGGGHYCPRHTEVALTRRCSFGHIVPSYALDAGPNALRAAVERTPGATHIHFHKKSMKKSRVSELREWFASPEGGGIPAMSSKELDDLQG